MALMLLTIIFFVGGFIAILYSVMALLSMLKFSQAQKALPEKFEPEAGKPATAGPFIAEVYSQRALILLKSGQFDAALADCKRAIDINPKHAEANILWKHALEREIPPEPVAEPLAKPAEKKIEKAAKRIKRKKKIVVAPIPGVISKGATAEEAAIVPEKAEPEKEIMPAGKSAAHLPPEPEDALDAVEPEPVPEEVPVEPEPEITLEPEETAPSLDLEAEAEIEPVAEEAPVEPGPEITLEPEEAPPSLELEAEAEIEPVAKPEPAVEIEEESKLGDEVIPEPFPEGTIPAEEKPPVTLEKPEPTEPSSEDEVHVTRKPLPGEAEGPLIPEDKIVTPKPPGESLLEEFDREKLREFEEGEAGAGDAEWTRFADKTGLQLPDSKIDMNELPAASPGLKETLSDLRQAEAHNLQGENHISKNLYNQAIKDFSRSLDINPNYVDALINRGSAYAQLGRFNDALMDFNHALKFEKKDSELFNKRGEVYMQNNMYDQAIKDFTSAVVLNPLFSDAYLNRGRAYSEKGMPEEAMNDFNQAIKADSDHSFGFVDRAAPSVNIDEESAGNKEEAAKFIQQGLANLKSEKYEEAVEDFTQAINISSSDAEGYINRGRAYIKLGKHDDAMADLNQAVLFDPLNASLYYWRAQAWKAKNDTFNMTEDLKLSCEMGYEPACFEYRKLKSAKK